MKPICAGKLRRAGAVIALALVPGGYVGAENLGTIGPTYPIQEPHLLRQIEEALRQKEKSGELARLEAQAKKDGIASVQNPRPVAGVKRTEKARTFYFDPSVKVERNITDDKGNVIVRAGTLKNPLEIVTLTRNLLFFDAREPRQVEQARKLIELYGGKVKPILVAGSYLELMKKWRAPVYFDQQGSLTTKLGITRVPALVTQEGKRLRIDELEVL